MTPFAAVEFSGGPHDGLHLDGPEVAKFKDDPRCLYAVNADGHLYRPGGVYEGVLRLNYFAQQLPPPGRLP